MLHATIAWLAREPGLLTGQDDAEYIVLSQSILQGGYNDLFRVDAPAHRTYPPAYPAALAGWSLVFGDHYDSFVALDIAFSTLFLVVLFIAVRRFFDVRIASLAVAVLALNPELVRLAGGVWSEPLYVLCSLLALYWAGRTEDRPRHAVAAMGAVLIGAATRSVGVTLLAAVAIHWVIGRRWKLVSIPAAVAVAAIGWFVWTAAAAEQFVGSSYMAELRSFWRGALGTGPLPGRAVRWAWRYVASGVPDQMAFPTVPGTVVDNAIAVVVLGSLILVGTFSMLKRWRPAGIYVVAYTALLLVWVFYVERFALPIVPLLVTAALVGAATVGARFGQRTGRLLPVFVAAVLALGATMRTQDLLRDRMFCDRAGPYPDPECVTAEQAAFFDALQWIDANTPADATFLTAKAGPLYLYTGRRSISFQASVDLEDTVFMDRLRERGAGWVLLTNLHHQESGRLAPRLRASCRQFALEASMPQLTHVFRITDAGTEVQEDACPALAGYMEATADR